MTGTAAIIGLTAMLAAEGLKRCGLGRALKIEDLGAALCVAIAALGGVIAGAVLPRIYPELPQDLDSWRRVGMEGAAGAVALYNLYAKRLRGRGGSRSARL